MATAPLVYSPNGIVQANEANAAFKTLVKVIGAATKTFELAGVDYQVPASKIFRILKIWIENQNGSDFHNYDLIYADDADGITNAVTLYDQFETHLGSTREQMFIADVPASKYINATGDIAGVSGQVFGVEMDA